jgi:hypothetical protein
MLRLIPPWENTTYIHFLYEAACTQPVRLKGDDLYFIFVASNSLATEWELCFDWWIENVLNSTYISAINMATEGNQQNTTLLFFSSKDRMLFFLTLMDELGNGAEYSACFLSQ